MNLTKKFQNCRNSATPDPQSHTATAPCICTRSWCILNGSGKDVRLYNTANDKFLSSPSKTEF